MDVPGNIKILFIGVDSLGVIIFIFNISNTWMF